MTHRMRIEMTYTFNSLIMDDDMGEINYENLNLIDILLHNIY